ncbi:hypothetical protein T439DRAFT_322487 [Meredithblackwellia eburnea MCA 4105]
MSGSPSGSGSPRGQSTGSSTPVLPSGHNRTVSATISPPLRNTRLFSSPSPLNLNTNSATTASTPETISTPETDITTLLRHASSVPQSRTGAVLSRGYILKLDQRPSPSQNSIKLNEPLHLRGAINFRMANLGVFGVAQPTETGLRTILNLLKAKNLPGGKLGKELVWVCTREEPLVYIGAQPYVLRDASHPFKTYALSDRPENLEEIEIRLKQDIIKEANKFGGIILVHEEIGEEEIRNTWVAVDSIRTVREVWDEVAREGYNLKYHRIPVTRDQSPEDRYLDTYASVLSSIPTTSSLVFNCGIGVVRTTFAMCAALIVRRRLLVLEGTDPFGVWCGEGDGKDGGMMGLGREGTRERGVLRARSEQQERDQSLLRLMNVLQGSLQGKGGQQMILSLLSSNPSLLENLRTALLGQYDIVLSLLSTLDHGTEHKKVVDWIVDHCDGLVNLRETVLDHRVRYASTAVLDEKMSGEHRAKALSALERYFFLISFSSYTHDTSFKISFSSWLSQRNEVAKMISRMRKTGHFFVFSPVHDLSAIAKGSSGVEAASGGLTAGVGVGGELVGDEWSRQIVRNRSGIILRTGMILKNDQWRSMAEGQGETSAPTSTSTTVAVRGAINFRRVPNSSLYGLSQPTEDGIVHVLENVRRELRERPKVEEYEEGAAQEDDENGKIVWINLREEPLLYINGTPYVLRQEAVSLRNVKSYAGISSTRLELLEDRLKSDVLSELRAFEGRLLLHTETDDGKVTPVWEVVEDERSIKTLREVMDDAKKKLGLEKEGRFAYRRIPITAEKSPDFSDVREIVEIVAKLDVERSAVIVNCQLGRGRSTRAQVLITLVQRWLQNAGHGLPNPDSNVTHTPRLSYTVINNLLRTIRSGQEVKNAVDDAITTCSDPYDVLDEIENTRQAAEDARLHGDEQQVKIRTERAIQNLRAYYFLILFASFLNDSKAETWRELKENSTYESYVRERPVFKTIERELDTAGKEALVPLEKPLAVGNALTNEVAAFVAKRSGRILSAFTLLKSDYFSGLQKMSLPEKLEGAPNFRRVRLFFPHDTAPTTPMAGSFMQEASPLVYGCGMATIDGLRRALERMGARSKKILWTGMREEPVIYVGNGRPHVLRLFDAPLENVVTTGVTTDTVEAMEVALKQDLIREAESNGGRILLHDEVQEADGSFTITACWEDVKPEEIMTPKEVYALMRREGLDVDYLRLPVTDEQAPIPGVFSTIEERVSNALTNTSSDSLGFVFSCQMGRGRTTTGMVAAALVSNILFGNQTLFDMSSSVVELETASQYDKGTWDGREAEPFLQGEYKLVLQLVAVLQYGRLAKKITDRAIDAMEGVQNLRKAIYDFKLRVEAADIGSRKQQKLFEVTMNYLFRYATLILFSNYLLEKAALKYDDQDEDDEVPRTPPLPPFREWLSARREIKRILQRRSLD